MTSLRTLRLLVPLALTATPFAQGPAPTDFDVPVVVVPHNQQRMNALLDLNGDGWTDAVGGFTPTSKLGAAFAYLNDGSGGLDLFFEDSWAQNADPDFPMPVKAADWNADGLDDFAVALRDEVRMYQSRPSPQLPFLRHSLITDEEITDMTFGDYDADGSLELALRLRDPNGPDEGLEIYDDLDGTPTLLAFWAPTGGVGFTLETIDYDGDGAMDLACLGVNVHFFTLSGTTLSIADWENTGLAQGPMGAVGDIDGDGDDDVVSFSINGSYRVLRQLAPASFSKEPIQTGGPATNLADADGDGDLDGVCCGGGVGTTTYYNTSASNFEIAWNDGTGAFAPSFRLPALGSNAIAGVDDLDQDGDPDLIAGRVVYYNQGGFEPLSTVSGTSVWRESMGDTDGDGDPDLSTGPDAFERNLASGWFETALRVTPTPPAGSTFAAPGFQADFDGDGDLDLLVTELQGGTAILERMFLNTGGGGLVDGGPVNPAGILIEGDPDTTSLLAGDVNGDGRLDLIARGWSNTLQQRNSRVFTQAADGTFDLATTLAGEWASVVADLDADGFDDLVTHDDVDLWVRHGDGSATMSALLGFPQAFGSYGTGERFAAGDLTGDGLPEVVAAHHVAGTTYDAIRILRNNGARQYVVQNAAIPGVFVNLAKFDLADVNTDGHLDLLVTGRWDPVANASVTGTSIFHGVGNSIAFTHGPADLYPSLMATADLDGDGDPDWVGYHGTDRVAVTNGVLDSSTSGARLQFGSATPGLGGQSPTLGAVGPFTTGAAGVGTGTIELRITGAAPGVAGKIFVGTPGQTVLPNLGATLEVTPIVQVPFQTTNLTGEWGSGSFTTQVTVPATAAGKTLVLQALVIDPAGQGGATVTNALSLSFVP